MLQFIIDNTVKTDIIIIRKGGRWIMTEKQKAKQRFFASTKEKTNFIPQCAVCKNVDGINCKVLKGIRPEKFYNNKHPEFQKCPNFRINKNAHLANEFKRLNDV